MSLHVRQIKSYIEKTFASAIDLSDCKSDNEKQQKLVSRGLVALALMKLDDVNVEDAAACIVDGPADNGIDGIYYSAPTNTVYFIQGKWNDSGNKTCETGDLHKFIKGCKDIVNDRWGNFNEKTLKLKDKISEALENPTIKIVLSLTYPSINDISQDCVDIINDFLNDFNNPTEIFFFRSVSMTGLLSVITERMTGKTKDVDCTLFEWGLSKEPYDAVYGQVACSDVAQWFEDNGIRLFTPNIRSFLGDTDVNIGIVDTILKKPESFWYVNNGITAICNSFSKKAIGGSTRDSGTFTLANLRIVNGAQTVGSIHAAWKKFNKSAESARVGIKIISIENAPIDFEAEITRKTNTQNRVESRDFIALDQNQTRIKHELFHAGIEYCFRAGERPADPSKGFDAQEAAISLSCANPDIKFSVLAKRNIGQLLNPQETDYKRLFDSVTGDYLWSCVQRVREVEAAISEKKKNLTGRDAQLLVHGNRVITNLVLKITKDRQTQAISNIVGDVCTSAQSFIEEEYKDAYLAVFFKNTEKCLELGRKVTSELLFPPLQLESDI